VEQYDGWAETGTVLVPADNVDWTEIASRRPTEPSLAEMLEWIAFLARVYELE